MTEISAPLDNSGLTLNEDPEATVAYETKKGAMLRGKAEAVLASEPAIQYRGKTRLIFTSPPFPLNRKKSYGISKGDAHKKWFVGLAKTSADLLTDTGFIVIEIGNSWEPGRPVQSLLYLESLTGFLKNPGADLRLCQQFVCHNPSRLPPPAQWVTINRIRMTDNFTHIWRMAKTHFAKADNSEVTRPYGADMQALLGRQSYDAGRRPLGHDVSENSFLKDRGGSIIPNLFELEPIDPKKSARLPNVFSYSNTGSSDYFSRTCRERKIGSYSERTCARTPIQSSDCRTTSFLSTHASLRPTPNRNPCRPCIAASTRTRNPRSPGLEP